MTKGGYLFETRFQGLNLNLFTCTLGKEKTIYLIAWLVYLFMMKIRKK